MDIIGYIPRGHENAVTRNRLEAMTGLSDRVVREQIETARKNGAMIINLQDGKGYFRPSNLEELQRQYRQNRSRAMSILVQQKHIRKEIESMRLQGEQIGLSV